MQTKPPLDEFSKPSHSQSTDRASEIFSPPGPVDYTKGTGDATTSSTGHCQYSNKLCRNQKLHGFRLCHKHILADRSSPYCRCSAMMDGRRCQNPAPKKADRTNSYCLLHEPLQKPDTRRKKRKGQDSETSATTLKKKPIDVMARDSAPQRVTSRRTSTSDTIASQRITIQGSGNSSIKSTNVQKKGDCASSEDELHFESSETDRIDCFWQGSQDSEAETTDSEDENPLNHAGTWTLEEAIQICREKMIKLKQLYTQQYKRVHQVLRSERGKMVRQFDMDPAVLAKVPITERTGSMLDDYEYDSLLSNYQRPIGLEILLEKAAREKKNTRAAHGSRRNDLARCQSNQGGHRCRKKVLPYSKFCRQHICSDPDQYLYSLCSVGLDSGQTCALAVGLFQVEEKCPFHASLLPRVINKGWENLLAIKQKDQSRLQQEGDSQTTDSASEQHSANDPVLESEDDTATDGISSLSAASVIDIVDRLSPAVLLNDVKLSLDTSTRAVNANTDAGVDKKQCTSALDGDTHSLELPSGRGCSPAIVVLDDLRTMATVVAVNTNDVIGKSSSATNKLSESSDVAFFQPVVNIPTSNTTVTKTVTDGILTLPRKEESKSTDSCSILAENDDTESNMASNGATLSGVSDDVIPPTMAQETVAAELSSLNNGESNCDSFSATDRKASETDIAAKDVTPPATLTSTSDATETINCTAPFVSSASAFDRTTPASFNNGTCTTTSVQQESSVATKANQRENESQGWFAI